MIDLLTKYPEVVLIDEFRKTGGYQSFDVFTFQYRNRIIRLKHNELNQMFPLIIAINCHIKLTEGLK